MIAFFFFFSFEAVKLRSAPKSEIKKAYGVETVEQEGDSLVEQYDMKMLFYQNVKLAKDVVHKRDNAPLEKNEFISPKQQSREKDRMEFLNRKIRVINQNSGSSRPQIEPISLHVTKLKSLNVELSNPARKTAKKLQK